MKKTLLTLFSLAGAFLASAQPQLQTNNIDEILKAMTPEEKVQLVVGAGKKTTRQGVPTGTIELIKDAAGMTKAIDRLGITAAVVADGPAGLRIAPTREDTDQTFYCTGFPGGILLASSWDTELVEKVTGAMGNEVLEYGVDILLAPGQNIQRNVLCGRNFEYFSEDPLLSGKMSAAYVKGVQRNGVGTSVKHFVANNQETNRFNVNAVVSRRALRELYLKSFEITVKEAKPWTVMSSYNRVNGPYTCENKDLLTTVLRDEWGFDGIVMTDWTGQKNTVNQILAGNDLMMPGEKEQREELLEALHSGILSEKDLDICVRRILELIVKTPRFKGYAFSNEPDLAAHAVTGRKAAAESIVLLKNDSETLPLKKKGKVAVYGLGSVRFYAGGAGSGDVNKPYVVDMVQACTNAGFEVDQELVDFYQANLDLYNARIRLDGRMVWPSARQEEPTLERAWVRRQADSDDVAIVVITRNAWEGGDRPLYGGFDLTEEEQQLLKTVSSAYHSKGKKMIVVLNVGGVVETASWKDLADAILLPWTPGQDGANAVFDVITGKVNPSGKTTISFPLVYTDDPSMNNFPYDIDNRGGYQMGLENAHRKDIDYVNYEEDIYVGYRYYDSFGKEVSYPFGFGLSYTSFAYSKPVVKATKDGFVASIIVTNTGSVSGREIVELYVTAPAGGLKKPARELKGFAKTRELAAGESQTLTIPVDKYSLASFNESASQWETAAGIYDIQFGAAVNDIRAHASYKTGKKVWKVHDVL
ncbi:MAG: glycoside hydrolase family 3 C-terminal domain-containing protein [Bacteroidales bacterium]|nr:glycoside hydrolase family 3 C-terminal domain-containing protein [Bacteroidales bacterium]